MQLLHFDLIQICIFLLHRFQVFEIILIQEIKQIEQFTDVVIQGRACEKYTVHRVESFEIVEYFTIIGFD